MVLAAKAFADPGRVRILFALRNAELCVCELCGALSVTQSTLSTHLQVIRKAGLVTGRKDGKWMYYALSPHGREMTRALFGCFREGLQRDPILTGDSEKLKRRVSLRSNGSCCVGYGGKTKACSDSTK
jgi:ArsR family transcriptional regulator